MFQVSANNARHEFLPWRNSGLVTRSPTLFQFFNLHVYIVKSSTSCKEEEAYVTYDPRSFVNSWPLDEGCQGLKTICLALAQHGRFKNTHHIGN